MKSYPAKSDFTTPLEQHFDHTDHRKRRRNRTTQSCLNCHTSKRRCDRKRPCHRCIQLGLTGNCVYEVDDPSLRDDPAVDEVSRLTNRIAELECLVRELRGKPTPKWTKPGSNHHYPNERWHSRSKHCQKPNTKRAGSASSLLTFDGSGDDTTTAFPSLPLTSIKVETTTDQPLNSPDELYRVAPSPTERSAAGSYSSELAVDSRYPPHFNTLDHAASAHSPLHSLQLNAQNPYEYLSCHGETETPSLQNLTPASESPPRSTYPRAQAHAATTSSSQASPSIMPSRNPGFTINMEPIPATSAYISEDQASYFTHIPSTRDRVLSSYCPCLTSAVTRQSLANLSHQLQDTMRILSSFHGHGQHIHDTQCKSYRQMIELNNFLRQHDRPYSSSSYDSLTGTPTDSDVLTPHSAAGSFRYQDSPSIATTTAGAGYSPGGARVVNGPSPTDWCSSSFVPVNSTTIQEESCYTPLYPPQT